MTIDCVTVFTFAANCNLVDCSGTVNDCAQQNFAGFEFRQLISNRNEYPFQKLFCRFAKDLNGSYRADALAGHYRSERIHSRPAYPLLLSMNF